MLLVGGYSVSLTENAHTPPDELRSGRYRWIPRRGLLFRPTDPSPAPPRMWTYLSRQGQHPERCRLTLTVISESFQGSLRGGVYRERRRDVNTSIWTHRKRRTRSSVLELSAVASPCRRAAISPAAPAVCKKLRRLCLMIPNSPPFSLRLLLSPIASSRLLKSSHVPQRT